jgi:hypothetical protein
MKLTAIRELLPCPDCGVDAGEYCVSRKGYPMYRYIHHNRSRALRTTLEEVTKLRDWLAHHADIFQEVA